MNYASQEFVAKILEEFHPHPCLEAPSFSELTQFLCDQTHEGLLGICLEKVVSLVHDNAVQSSSPSPSFLSTPAAFSFYRSVDDVAYAILSSLRSDLPSSINPDRVKLIFHAVEMLGKLSPLFRSIERLVELFRLMTLCLYNLRP